MAGLRFARYLTWDSSPQFKRDYVLAVLRSILRSELPKLFQLMVEMRRLWERTASEPEDFNVFGCRDRRRREREMMATLRAAIVTHALPAVLVGFGASSFAFKFKTLIHALRLEHFSDECLAHLIKEIILVDDFSDDRKFSLFVNAPWPIPPHDPYPISFH